MSRHQHPSGTARVFHQPTADERAEGKTLDVSPPPPATGGARGTFPSRVRRLVRFWIREPIHRLYVAIAIAVVIGSLFAEVLL